MRRARGVDQGFAFRSGITRGVRLFDRGRQSGRPTPPQPGLFDHITEPTTKRQASPASHHAAAIAQHCSSHRARAALRLYATGAELTADECAARLGLKPLQIRPRCSNLLRAGLLEITGAQRPTELGTLADVHRITANGLRLLAGEIGRPA